MAAAESGGIFISYRRQDTKDFAGRLYERLANRFGEAQVFMDVVTIELGVDFAEAIAREVGTCKVLLAIIGPQWLTTTDAAGYRRLDDPDDMVRLEVEAALARSLRVIPILDEGAAMPARQDLPESLVRLARRNALIVRHDSFRSDSERLITAIQNVLRAEAPGGPSPAAYVQMTPHPPRRVEAEPGAATPLPRGSPRDDSGAVLPRRQVPSTIDDITAELGSRAANLGRAVGGASSFMDLHNLVANRIDSPYFLGLQGRAAICLRLSPLLVDDLGGVALGLLEQEPNIHFTAYLRGGYPILRTVLLLPVAGESPLMFESPLLLTNGDVQEFYDAAVVGEMIELHVGHTVDHRRISVACATHRIQRVLGTAIDALCKAPFPVDGSEAVKAVDRMAEDFPSFMDGLSADTAAILELRGKAASIVKVDFMAE